MKLGLTKDNWKVDWMGKTMEQTMVGQRVVMDYLMADKKALKMVS